MDAIGPYAAVNVTGGPGPPRSSFGLCHVRFPSVRYVQTDFNVMLVFPLLGHLSPLQIPFRDTAPSSPGSWAAVDARQKGTNHPGVVAAVSVTVSIAAGRDRTPR